MSIPVTARNVEDFVKEKKKVTFTCLLYEFEPHELRLQQTLFKLVKDGRIKQVTKDSAAVKTFGLDVAIKLRIVMTEDWYEYRQC